uniref:TNFR-Cys domain-containing protein n=1 Tax=Salarias fasciatus TaxID=181472 RepID=A0A672HW97_SALFA
SAGCFSGSSGESLAMAAAQLQCDPVTQYEDRGRCCLKCEPGTSMKSGSSCEEPQCKECEDNEYQEKYTTATKCERQDYCDENRNFKWRTLQNKKKRIPCECKDGFHCSSELCLTCVPHRMCPPGLGARSIGNHTHDTVCEKCPEGQFSNDSSWRSVCQKWTVCGNNFHVSKEGTAESDVECGKLWVGRSVVKVFSLSPPASGAAGAEASCGS